MWDITTGALTPGVLKGEGLGREGGGRGHRGQAALVITRSKIRQRTFRKQFWTQLNIICLMMSKAGNSKLN